MAADTFHSVVVVKEKRKWWKILLAIIAVLVFAFVIYVSTYYKADQTAEEALTSADAVAVSQTETGWLFDGPSEDTALIFYPGGKVQETAYAPFLQKLAESGLDVYLVKMPFRLAVFDISKADDVLQDAAGYSHWYIGGHSLGGAMAAVYAAEHGDALDGVILCAAYPTKPLEEDLLEVSLYGSEDQVLDLAKTEEGAQYAPADLTEHVIDGGNHAQFGSYGAQKGDGTATISADEQQEEAAEVIAEAVRRHYEN